MELKMRIDENFVSKFLKSVMDGIIDSKQKKFIKDNPEIRKQVKKLKDAKDDLKSAIEKL